MKSLNFLLCAVLLVGGCFRSLQPVYTTEQVVFVSALVGEWVVGSETWAVTKSGAAAYRVVHTDENGASGVFLGHLFNVDGHLFVDLVPVQTEFRSSGLHSGAYQPIHMLARVVRTAPTPQFAPLEGQWLNEYLAQHPHELRHERIDTESVVTASTSEIQAFLLRHVKTPKAFQVDPPWERAR